MGTLFVFGRSQGNKRYQLLGWKNSSMTASQKYGLMKRRNGYMLFYTLHFFNDRRNTPFSFYFFIARKGNIAME